MSIPHLPRKKEIFSTVFFKLILKMKKKKQGVRKAPRFRDALDSCRARVLAVFPGAPRRVHRQAGGMLMPRGGPRRRSDRPMAFSTCFVLDELLPKNCIIVIF